jgi:hypothetical protein
MAVMPLSLFLKFRMEMSDKTGIYIIELFPNNIRPKGSSINPPQGNSIILHTRFTIPESMYQNIKPLDT